MFANETEFLGSNTVGDVSMVAETLEATKFEKLINKMQPQQTRAAHIDPSFRARPRKFGGGLEAVGADAWLNIMRMYLSDQPHSPENSNVLILLTFLDKHAQTWIMQKMTAARETREGF